MGKCYIDSVNDKLVLNGSSINFSEFVKYTNGKILSVDGTEIIDGQLLSRLTVSGGKLALDGILVNGLDLGNISANILPSADTMYNLGSTSKKYLRGYFGEVNTSTINLDAGAITYDGTNSVLKLGTSTIATREWVNSSAIPVLKTINGQSITGSGDITIVGGTGGGQSYMDIQYGYMSGTTTNQAPNVFVPFAQTVGNGTLDYTAKIDDSTILIKAGVLYKFEGQVNAVSDDDASYACAISFGLYSDIAGANLIKSVDFGYEYTNSATNLLRNSSSYSYIKSDVDCYLKGKTDVSTVTDSVGFSLTLRNVLTKYNTTPIITTGTTEMPSYSTNETLTEKRWIDGKPIYRKVFTYNVGATAPADDITITTGLLGVDLAWIESFKLLNTTSTYTSSNTYFVSDTNENRIFCTKDGSSISIGLGDNSSGYINNTYYITLEYTKTTDTASSPVATQNLVCTQGAQSLPGYSATETLTERRWIDGKPIYRKVITYVPAVVSTSYTIDTVLTSTNCQIVNSNIVINDDTGQYDKTTSANAYAYCGVANAGVYFATSNAGAVGKTHYIWLEYTKTSDTSGSPVALVGGVQDSQVSKFVGASLYPSTSQSLTASTATKVLLDSIEFDSNSGLDSTNGRYVVPVSGYYNVVGAFNGSVSTNITNYIYVNGVSVKTGVNTTGTRCQVSGILYLNKGDYVELFVWSGVVANVIVPKIGTYLSLSLIAPNYGGQNTLPDYSTTETLTSERWIDGKPIYKKVVNAGGFTTNTTTSVSHNISGVDQIWIDEGNSFLRNGSNSVPLNQTLSSSNLSRVYVSNSNIYLYTNTDYSAYTAYVTICYTKATDTSSSPVTTIGGGGTPKKYYARISNGTATTLNRTQGVISIPLNTIALGDSVMSNGTGFIAPQDDVYTVTAQFFSSNTLNANITEIGIIMYVNGVEDGKAFVNPGSTGGSNKGCNGTFITKLNKNDVITFRMTVWATDTTSALQIPVGSFVANIRN